MTNLRRKPRPRGGRRLTASALVLVLVAAHQSLAKPPSLDGQWIADVPVQGKCPAAHLTLFVLGGSIIGSVYNGTGTFPITGHIDDSGNGNITIVEFGGRIKFSNDRFAADYFNACGERRAVGKKLMPGPTE